jgi:hypothetical protein
MALPDPNHMIKFCREVMPDVLAEACEVEPEFAWRIGEDVLARAEAFAALSEREQDVVIAPFVEEVFDHEPREVSLAAKAQVTVVVRNTRGRPPSLGISPPVGEWRWPDR